MATSPPMNQRSSSLIRSFSDLLEQEGSNCNIAKGLNTKVQTDRRQEERLNQLRSEWPLLFAEADHLAQINIPSEEAQLLKSSRALAQAWAKFQKKLPNDPKGRLENTPPSISVVFNAVDDAQKSWQTHRDDTIWGGVKASFAKVSRCAEDHSQLLAVIPRNDKYLSIICGSLSAIAKASVNHEEVAEAVAKSLADLCEDIIYWKRLVLAHRDVPSIQNAVRELYVVIFDFLTTLFTKWSSSPLKRFVKSFDQNAVSKLFETKRKEMKALEAKMKRAADLETSETVFDMKKILENMNSPFYEGDRKSLVEELLLGLGRQQQRFLEELDLKPQPATNLVTHNTESSAPGADESEYFWEPKLQQYRRTDIIAALLDIESKVKKSFDDLQHLLNQAEHVSYDRRVQIKLQNWATTSDASSLWLEGPPHVPRPSQNTLCAIALVVAARESGFNTLSFFCSANSYRATTPNTLLLELLSMIVTQLLFFLPQTLTTATDLSAARIQRCLSLQSNALEALQLFNDIRELALGPLICIIEGAQDLEDRSLPEHWKSLAQVVDALCDVDRSGNFTRLCLTSDGYVGFLAEKVAQGELESERYELESSDPGADDDDHDGNISFYCDRDD